MGLSTSLPNAVVQPGVCTSTTRPSSPYKGQTIYETDTGRLLVYYGVTTGWQLPWGQPWGLITSATQTAYLTTSGTTELTVFSTGSFTWVANRNYLITLSMSPYDTTASSTYLMRVRNNSAAGTVLQSQYLDTVLNRYTPMSFSWVQSGVAAGSSSGLFFTCTRASGTGTLVFNGGASPSLITMTDIGPAVSTAPTA